MNTTTLTPTLAASLARIQAIHARSVSTGAAFGFKAFLQQSKEAAQ